MRTSLPCGRLGSSSLSLTPLYYTVFGYCTATHSWHSFRGPCLLIPMAYSWPSLGCLLHVRSTPWLTGSSFLNGEGVQRVCSCHHNKWAARLPLTALLQTVCGFLGHCKTAAQRAGVVLRKWTKPPWESASWLPPRLQQSAGAEGGNEERWMVGLFTELSVSMWLHLCRCRKLQVFNTAWPTSHILSAAHTRKKPWEWGYFTVSILISRKDTQMMLRWIWLLPYFNTATSRIVPVSGRIRQPHLISNIWINIHIYLCLDHSSRASCLLFMELMQYWFYLRGSFSDDKGGGIHERWFRWDSVMGQQGKAPEEKIWAATPSMEEHNLLLIC